MLPVTMLMINTLTVYIKRLREKLNIDDIITIKGIGYRVNKHE